MQVHPSGTRIAGRYEVAGRPLVGGMGIVYLCFDHQEQRPVALKTFKPEYLPDRAARERFLEEGNTWVRLGKHPHVVRCYEVFQDRPRPEVYLVLELVAKEQGRRDASLRSWLTLGKPLPVDQAVLIALQIVRGMRHATETIPRFVHRDLKPENVLVGADRLSNAPINRVRVTDFGLVRGLRVEQAPAATAADLALGLSRLTRIGSIVGTPHYMAPEQWEGADVTMRADIYALGCILGEMLTGRMLVQGRTLDELRRAHQEGHTWAAAQLAPTTLHELLRHCLMVDPSQRFADFETVEPALANAYFRLVGQPTPGPEIAGDLNRAEQTATGWSLRTIGESYLDLGRPERALEYFQQSLQTALALNEKELEAECLSDIGHAYRHLGDARRAITFYERSMVVFDAMIANREESDAMRMRAMRAWAMHFAGVNQDGIGSAYRQLGDLRRAITFHENAVANFRSAGIFPQSEGEALGNLGIVYRELGDPNSAVQCHEKALTIFRGISDLSGESKELSNLASVYLSARNPQQALSFLEHALSIRSRIGDEKGTAADLINMALAHRYMGDFSRSIESFERALVVSRKFGDKLNEGLALSNLGGTYLSNKDYQSARSCLEQALMILRTLGYRLGEVDALANLGLVYYMLGDADSAIKHYEWSLDICMQNQYMHKYATFALNLAGMQTGLGNNQAALLLAQEAAHIFTRTGHVDHAQQARQLVARLEEASASASTGTDPVEILGQFAPVINAVVAGAVGDHAARAKLEEAFPVFTQNHWMIADPIRRIWVGERDETTLTASLDNSEALIIREILKRL